MDDLRKELRLISSSINAEIKASRKQKRKPDLEKIKTLKAKSKPLGWVQIVAHMGLRPLHTPVQTTDCTMQDLWFWVLQML